MHFTQAFTSFASLRFVQLYKSNNYLVSKSVSSITKISEIEEHLAGKYRPDSIKSALEFLEENGIVITTGTQDLRVFFKNPPLMNCITAHVNRGAEYGWELMRDKDMVGGLAQASLGLIGGRSKIDQQG